MAGKSLDVSAEGLANTRKILQLYMAFLKLLQKENIVLSLDTCFAKGKYWQGRGTENGYKDV